MNIKTIKTNGLAVWFVGAAYDQGSEDQMPRFLEQGIWENGYTDRYLEQVRSIKVGDRIAIKAAYTRKRDLPFDNKDQVVSVMSIKAIGVVTENLGDGRHLKVNWTKLDSPKEWYFYTNRMTVWKVMPGSWATDALIDFTFNNKVQDISKFRNAPFWRERFGDLSPDKQRFEWTKFYEAVADKLLAYKENRTALVKAVYDIAKRSDGLNILNDVNTAGEKIPLKDICPFTVFGFFNRGITDTNRISIAGRFAEFLGVTEPIPTSFDGVPLLNNQASWFFGYENKRLPEDIDNLWNVFAAAIKYSNAEDIETRNEFQKAYDKVITQFGVKWNLTMALFWIRPWSYATLESQSKAYLEKKLKIEIRTSGPKKICDGNEYLRIVDILKERFQEEVYPVHSFPEMSYLAWKEGGVNDSITKSRLEDFMDYDDESAPESELMKAPIETYAIDNIISDGCFLERSELSLIVKRLQDKKNIILQGPPGTGKTWLAKRLAFALMGEKNDNKVRAVQFHANLSYEDFVRGWRPSGDGKLSLIDGPLMQMITSAIAEPTVKHVLVIEEINRGNPAQILGEMLTLLEADKRTPTEALELSYRKKIGEGIFIPHNLYLIGTMNLADRSLALVDFALRRRFAFIDLKPTFGNVWQSWVNKKFGIDIAFLKEVESRIKSLNEQIASDETNLGKQYCIGHSFVTPALTSQITDPREWFRQIVETEIGPLLHEYWYDSPKTAKDAQNKLTEGL
ncbi:MAG: AAA family ATPase [Fibrobacteres bacterium]|nr:AAA family ATPase [Fibrobacterota bacterium]